MIRKRRHELPQLNTASVADISFMLLILFLVVTSMDVDKGLSRLLPPIDPPEEEQVQTTISQRNVMKVSINEVGGLIVDGEKSTLPLLKKKVMAFVDNPNNQDDKPQKSLRQVNGLGNILVSDHHVIQLETDRRTSYDVYFQVLNEIVGAYRALRDQLARQRWGISYAQCDAARQEALRMVYPQRLSETYAQQEGGEI